jgi:gamma-glutamylaminecyclotransferase
MIHVFVYGSLKRGFRNYHFLATSRFIGTGTTSCDFDLLDLGYFPAAIRPGEFAIRGELFAVDRRTLKTLDFLESNGSFYQREQHPVIAEGTGLVSAWIYLLLEPAGLPAVAAEGHLKTWVERAA